MSQAPPPGYAPPPQPGVVPPAPKKRKTWLIVLLVIVVLFVLGIAGCIALVGGAAKTVSDTVEEVSASQSARNAPREVEEGKSFEIGKHQTLAGWEVEKVALGDESMFTVSGKAKNVSDETSTAFVHFKFLSKDGEVLGNVQCNTGDLEPGQTEKLNCIPDGKWGKYDKITAEATF